MSASWKGWHPGLAALVRGLVGGLITDLGRTVDHLG
jgi:hypothetical protein